jgi:hypothetical protein
LEQRLCICTWTTAKWDALLLGQNLWYHLGANVQSFA